MTFSTLAGHSLWFLLIAAVKLIGKASAEQDPSSPTNFRAIALTACVGKLFTTIFCNRWLSFMIDNGYLDQSVQKAFDHAHYPWLYRTPPKASNNPHRCRTKPQGSYWLLARSTECLWKCSALPYHICSSTLSCSTPVCRNCPVILLSSVGQGQLALPLHSTHPITDWSLPG